MKNCEHLPSSCGLGALVEKIFDKREEITLIARFMGPTWGPSGASRTEVGPMLAPWTLLTRKAEVLIKHALRIAKAIHVSFQLQTKYPMPYCKSWQKCHGSISSYKCANQAIFLYQIKSKTLVTRSTYKECNWWRIAKMQKVLSSFRIQRK